jgi:1,4-alpha-glucan branching enzyme
MEPKTLSEGSTLIDEDDTFRMPEPDTHVDLYDQIVPPEDWVSAERTDAELVTHVPADSWFFLPGYPAAKRVALAGSFNDWQPDQLVMARKGELWTAVVSLPHGKHYYKFVIDGESIVDPDNPDVVQNESGSTVSVRSVL